MKPSELPGARSLYRLTNRALAQIRELWQYAGEDELPPDSLLQAQVEALRILHIDVPLSAKRQFQLFCSEHFPGLADILDCLAADQLWALLSMGVQLAVSDQPHAQSAAVRFGGLGRRYVLVAFDDRPAGLLSHADGSGLFPEARPKLTALSWEDIRLALMLVKLRQHVTKSDGKSNRRALTGCCAQSASSSIRLNSRQFPGSPEEKIFGQG